MKHDLPLPQDKKLTVTYRIEPGCLGPNGSEKVSDFCEFAENGLRTLDSDYVIWNIKPRLDKRLPEMQYTAIGKTLNHAQAEKYLWLCEKALDEFECHLSDRMATLIDDYLTHH